MAKHEHVESHAELRERAHSGHSERLRERGGHSDGGHISHEDMKADKKEIDGEVRKAFGQHDAQLHGGRKTRLKLKAGGVAEGKSTHHRLDRASGGRAKKGGKGHTSVNVIVAPQGGAGAAGAPGMPPGIAPHPMMPPAGPPMGGAGALPPGPGLPPGMPPRPPMAGPPPGGPPPGMAPPGGMPPRPPGMMNRGGRTHRASGGKLGHDGEAGSASGLGRLEKIKDYGKNADDVMPGERKRGGKC